MICRVDFKKRVIWAFGFVLLGTPFAYSSGVDLNEIKAIDLKGTSHSIKLSQAKLATVVVFLSAKCPCSADHEPILDSLAQEFKGAGFQFVGIHSNADE